MAIEFEKLNSLQVADALLIYRACATYESCHWSGDYPNAQIVAEDIAQERLYRVWENDQILGIAAMGNFDIPVSFDDGVKNPAWIFRFGILPEHRGKGTAKRVLACGLDMLRQKGHDFVRLFVYEENLPAKHLYQNAGFTSLGVTWARDDYYLRLVYDLQQDAPITIRTATAADAPALQAIYAPYVENTAVTFAYAPPTIEQMGQKVEKTLEKYPYLVAEQNGQIVGYCYASPFYGREAYDWDCETSIYVRRDLRAKGVGRALYKKLEEVLLAQGIFNLYACIAVTDTPDAHLTNASEAFHAHLGYETVARFDACGYKFDRWYDMIWMQKRLLSPIPTPPPVRKTFAQVKAQCSLN